MLEFLSNPALFPLYYLIGGTIVGAAANYWFDNYYNKPKVKALVYQVASQIEKATPEGTPVDTFLDHFLSTFKKETGREPNAGELKSAVDIANKKFDLEFNKPF